MVFPARSVLIWISPALSRSEYYVPAVKRIQMQFIFLKTFPSNVQVKSNLIASSLDIPVIEI